MLLKIIPYFNITLALLYFVLYLLNSSSFTMLAMLLVIIHNGLVLRIVQRESTFHLWHYALGLSNLVFAGFLSIWLANIIHSSLEYNYFVNSWLYILISALFIIGIVLQFITMIISHD